MTLLKLLAVLCLALTITACSTRRESNPQRTATEQLLISAAADRAAERVELDLPQDAKVFVDATNFEGLDGKYAVAAIRERLLRSGAGLAPDRGNADVVVEIRSGALSIDEKKILVGVPQFDVPIPLAGAVGIPEIALFKKAERKGVAKFAGVGYGAKDGKLTGASGDQYGFSRETRWVFLLFFSWETSDYLPEEQRESAFDVEVWETNGD